MLEGAAKASAPKAATSRRKAREFAFRVLFESEQGKQGVSNAWQNAKDALAEGKTDFSRREGETMDAEALSFAHRLVLGYDDKRFEIDQTLQRLASFEIMHSDTPPNAVMEVMIRLAKKYGGEESGRFVNGVLARLVKHLEMK